MSKDDKKDAAADAPKKSKKKKLIIIIAAAAIALGGGASFFLVGKKDEKAADAKKPAAEKKIEKKSPAQYIALDPPFVVNFDAGSSARFLQVTVQLMTRDLETVEFLKQHDPVIRNDLLLLLGNVKYEQVQTREGKEALREQSL